MIESEILQEKYRVQKRLFEESSSVRGYLLRSHLAAEQVATSHGFRLQYATLPNKRLEPLSAATEPNVGRRKE
ncbi:hypothetical protein CKO40_23280 [Halochromatium glycolicum]|jgi:hypothetical protein|uniref:Uncharacterized protein n=1 Tax=Halochromatium glycolicum TaxID=85075 RepID=A0AAJ0U8M6_9GAMM|nr:hypothetical protein [Halochromatium glycolicum]